VQEPAHFEAADVRISPAAAVPYLRGGFTDRGTYELHFATIVDLISIAWNVDFAKVTGGPNWLDWDRFDVIAKVPAGATIDTVRPMLQNLLADRFHLIVHNGTKQLPAFVLSASLNPRLKPSKGADESGCEPDGPKGGLTAGPRWRVDVLVYLPGCDDGRVCRRHA
jgi:uncharacterized protein (TIGR03435 family)